MQPSNQPQPQRAQFLPSLILAKGHDLCTVFDRFYERAKHEHPEHVSLEWGQASGPPYKSILGDPTQLNQGVPTLMIPQGMVGQIPLAKGSQGQVMQRGNFHQPQMGGAIGQMVPVAFPQQMQIMPTAMPAQGQQLPQRQSVPGAGYPQRSQGQGGQQSRPRGKGQGPGSPPADPSGLQIAFVAQGAPGYPQAFMIPAAGQINDQNRY